jgi:hypothetical protein
LLAILVVEELDVERVESRIKIKSTEDREPTDNPALAIGYEPT